MYEEHEFETVTAVTRPTPRRNAEKYATEALYILDAQSAPRFRIGQAIQRGEILGCFGFTPVTSFREGVITSIEYDGWRNEVIVVVGTTIIHSNEERSGRTEALHYLVS